VGASNNRSFWQPTCACTFPTTPDYPASAADVTAFRELLRARGVDESDWFAKWLLTSLAETKTRVVVQSGDAAEVVITLDEVQRVLGHDL
jgi:hypothetical protein